MHRILIICAALLFIGVCACGQDMKITRNIEYGKNTLGKSMVMHIVEADDGVHFKPAMVCIHGGGWSAGDAESMIGWAGDMAKLGFKCFSIEYTLSGEAKWPAQITDCKTAVRHIRANAKKYDINPNKIGAFGHSAGGHLACMLGVLKPGEYEGAEHPGVSSMVQGVVNYCGRENLTFYGPYTGLINLVGGSDRDKITAADPYSHVSRSSAPHMLIHGTTDDLVEYQQADPYRDKLIANKVKTKWLLVEGGWHIIDNYDIWPDIAEFCREVFF